MLSWRASSCSCTLDSLGAECGGSARGTCQSGRCVCDPRLHGAACEKRLCRNEACMQGDACYDPSVPAHLASCSANGVCGNGACECRGDADPYMHCATSGCPGGRQCAATGTCSGGQCACSAGFSGAACDVNSCAMASATRPGWLLTVQSNGAQFLRRTVGWLSGTMTAFSDIPALPANVTASYRGVVRARLTGLHTFVIARLDAPCVIVLTTDSSTFNTTISSTTQLSVNVSLSAGATVTVTVTLVRGATSRVGASLSWIEPGSSTQLVPPDVVTHTATCTGCQGCCVDAAACRCSAGATGVGCTDLCASGQTTPGWLATYFASSSALGSNTALGSRVLAAVDENW
jgi:hypothetical protein